MPPCVRISPSSTVSLPGPTCRQPVKSLPLKSGCQSLDWARASELNKQKRHRQKRHRQKHRRRIFPLIWEMSKIRENHTSRPFPRQNKESILVTDSCPPGMDRTLRLRLLRVLLGSLEVTT